ncbi:MAG: PQQ-binding-like beta-propeller repeat protein [Pirellulales bacterium]|nr:PQQ-binding-like beta-propeller repeat protein [Pirellulales bacterium]
MAGIAAAWLGAGLGDNAAAGGDWPLWGYDAGRTNASPHDLPAALHPEWIRDYPALEPAWEDPVNQDRMPFDRVYEPIVVGTTLLFGSNRNDRLTALDTRTGRERWRFYADGPIRFPPAADGDRVFFVSDDGFLYCVSVATGELLWRHRGGPDGRKALGNGRLCSAWPARGGPVVRDGVVYFGASIWPFMGTFVQAVDAASGKVLWSNEGLGAAYVDQPHNAPSFAGLAPQGALAATADRLIVPGGRSVPACLDRRTGALLYYHLAGSPGANRKLEGGSQVAVADKHFFNHRGLNTALYDLATGKMIVMWPGTVHPVLTDDVCYLSGKPVVAHSLGKPPRELWRADVDARGALLRAGNRLYAGGKGRITAMELAKEGPPRVVWTHDVQGTVARLVAADDRLFAVTEEGQFHAFGPEKPDQDVARPPSAVTNTREAAPVDPEPAALVEAMLASTTIGKGYCFVFGASDEILVEALARREALRVIAVDPDAERVARLRRRLDDAGLYGAWASVHVGEPSTFGAPPYLAALAVCDAPEAIADADLAERLRHVFHSLRPYGGVAWLRATDDEQRDALRGAVEQARLERASVESRDGFVLLRRDGPLAGAGAWTHQNGNVANTAKSDDRRVRLPLGLLWFGGNQHKDILPRHGHAPPEQVIGGRAFLQGTHSLTARDVYTGVELWQRRFDDLGTAGVYFDKTYDPNPLATSYNQVHIPGANARGTNVVAAIDAVYLIVKDECLALDPATGETLRTFSLPEEGDKEKPDWGYLGVYDDLLLAGAGLVPFSKQLSVQTGRWDNYDHTSSRRIVVMNRHTGKVLWDRAAKLGFRHNAIAAGAGKLFLIDSLPEKVLHTLARRGKAPRDKPILLALDIRSGETLWSDRKDIFGTWLGYSIEHDILLEGGRLSADMLQGEPTSPLVARRGADGNPLWKSPLNHGGPCMLHGRTVYFNAVRGEGAAADLLTGQPKTRVHPLTGRVLPWDYHRRYGCNAVIAGEHMLTFRSGAAGFFDLDNDGGTGNFGGFKSSCTSNLIAADGVLNAPDYTRTCTCAYQNQTSLALVHMPDAEIWTFNQYPAAETWPARVQRLGINFGAPGDRREPDGALWLDWPSVGGPSPDVPLRVEPTPRLFFHHSLRFAGGQGPAWVAASGLEGEATIAVDLLLDESSTAKKNAPGGSSANAEVVPVSVAEGVEKPRTRQGEPPTTAAATYTVELFFAEPLAESPPEGRVFDVLLQGKKALAAFDPAGEAGGARRGVARTFPGVAVDRQLVVTLAPVAGRPPVLCGLKVTLEPPEPE